MSGSWGSCSSCSGERVVLMGWFRRRFALADHIRVTAASHENGMLHIDLVREIPEALKPRQIQITAGGSDTVVDAKAVN